MYTDLVVSPFKRRNDENSFSVSLFVWPTYPIHVKTNRNGTKKQHNNNKKVEKLDKYNFQMENR